MGYVILGIITFVLIIYFIYDAIRMRANQHRRDISDDEFRRLYEGDGDGESNRRKIKSIETRLSTEFAEEVLNSELEYAKDQYVDEAPQDEEDELKR